MSTIKNIAKHVINYGTSYVYHYEQNRVAKKILKVVESEKGKLDSKIKKTCREYASDVFGDKIYAPWLYTYSAFSREFKEGWIPDNFYGNIVVPQLKGDYGKLGDRNVIIPKILNKPNFLDLCYYVNHLFLSLDNKVIDENKLRELLFSDNSKVVFKVENSIQGKGVYFLDESNLDLNHIKRLGNGVFQKYIIQHPFFSEFHSKSVATIRLTSISDNYGQIDVRAGYFRFASGDDTHVMSKSQMRIPINLKNGKLHNTAYFPNSKSTNFLPENDIVFSGKTVPSFENCIATVKTLHNQMPYIRCIGWDLIVDKDNNVLIIEFNGAHNGITFTEMTQGPCFKGLGWETLKK